MRFLFKINSGYDGFRPAVIPERLEAGVLPLGWTKYIESVEEGNEVWVYFRGPHAFDDGIYVKGTVAAVEVEGRRVLLRPVAYSTDEPLEGREASRTARAAAATPYRQVFLLPEELLSVACDLATTAETCAARRCDGCSTWNRLPRIRPRSLRRPHRLSQRIARYVPAYWVIPPRSFIYYGDTAPRPGIKRTSELFMRFKTGSKELAYPLALGLSRALEATDSDAIVPIPLSPEKEQAGEIHRTRLLAEELSSLTGVPVAESLRLTRPTSKKRLKIVEGLPDGEFEARYHDALEVAGDVRGKRKILLLDDVCTEGSTLTAAANAVWDLNGTCEISAVTAGQMVVRDAVADETLLVA